jgi:hypothetical protein
MPALCRLISIVLLRFVGGPTGVDLVGDPANGVGNRLEDNDPSEPSVNQVHGVERDTSEFDDGVVATSQEE